jgi:hypothetical protein
MECFASSRIFSGIFWGGTAVWRLVAMGLCMLALPTAWAATGDHRALCDDNAPLCTEISDLYNGVSNYEGRYVGHDEPSVLFYSNIPGSGNSNVYRLRLPKDPPRLPTQDGTGGTFNFQLHPAFWVGMAMCDTQSFPNPGQPCTPDSDSNIFDSADPTAADYIGKHPGTAFMEMQFYPPGWVLWPEGNSCDPTKWCAALNIDSLSQNPNTGQILNPTCQAIVGLEYVNFAFITKNGVAHAPANPVDATLATFTPNPTTDLFMNSGDWLVVELHDTPQGLEIVINDLTTGETGSMTASAANGFGQVQFAPTGTDCNNIPYDFHPMYSTSSEHTRVPWAAHSYNVAFSDEIGHFEYCNAVDANGNCTQTNNSNDPGSPDGDDIFCFPASASSRIQIGGCFGTDQDFDGVSYQLTWPGSLSNPGQNTLLNPGSILFSSPTFAPTGQTGILANFSRVAFEADLPRIEFATNPPCNRNTGANCVNPPVGANFYPIYSTRMSDEAGGCVWQLGGANIPGSKNTFGGTSTAEYGPLLLLAYPGFNNTPIFRFNNFRNILNGNACPSGDAN